MQASRNPWLMYFAAINALVTAVIALSTVPAEILFAFAPGAPLPVLALPGQFFLLALIMYLPLAITKKLVSDKRNIVIPAAILYSLLVFIVFINAWILDLFRFHINGVVLNLSIGEGAAQIFSIPFSTWTIVFEGFAGLCVGEWILAETLYNRFDDSKNKPFAIWLALAIVMFGGQVFDADSEALDGKTVNDCFCKELSNIAIV